MNLNFILNLVRGEIERYQSRHNRKMVGLIDSYNAADHTAKVKFPTELDANGNPRITGWIPIQTQSAGAGTSWVFGPVVGDQCTVEYLEGDSESGHVTGFLHNTTDTPPSAASGQAILRHTGTGNYFTLDTDGSFKTLHKSSGNYVKVDASGNMTALIVDPTKTQHYIGGDPALGHTMSPIVTVDGPSIYGQARFS